MEMALEEPLPATLFSRESLLSLCLCLRNIKQISALFLIMSDTDASFNFLISLAYSQLFNLLCEKADDECGGRLPVHVRTVLLRLILKLLSES